jgi:hypothetical protein
MRTLLAGSARAWFQAQLERPRRDQLEAPLRHRAAELLEAIAEDALGVGQEDRLFVGDVVEDVAHQLHDRSRRSRHPRAPSRAAGRSAGASRRARERSCRPHPASPLTSRIAG